MTNDDFALTTPKALAILGLEGSADLEAIKTAFQSLAASDHPDRPGGDPVRFNQVLLAYRYLQSNLPRTNDLGEGLELLAISPQEACQGGKRRLAQPVGPDLDVVIPAGLRTGERFNLATEQVEIVIRPEGNLSVEGDDVWLTVEASHSLLQSGGRLEFSLFDRPYRIWLTKALAQARQIHLPGLGLPPRADHGQGDGFVQLVPLASEANGTPAQQRRRQFIADWIEL
jgi:DnaJ-class molecular chaperone